ncbi:MAG: type 4a pilus biogenesis protein PilO [Patescibacteria group bacterium]
MKKEKLTQTVLVLGACALLSLGVVFGVGYTTTKLFQDKADLLASIAREQERETDLIRLKKDLAQALPELEKLDAAFVTKDEVPQFLSLIEETASRRGLELAVESLDTVLVGEKKQLKVNATFRGSFKGAHAFLSDLENLPYVLTIGTFESQVLSEGVSGWSGRVILFLKSYEE